jgi:hypothetical protein
MNQVPQKLSDETIVYIRDILALALISQTDIVNHLRGMEFETVLKGETHYLVPTERYKVEYANVAKQLVALAEAAEGGEGELAFPNEDAN